MKLLTHNMLMSPGTRNGYPLAIEVERMEQIEAEFNADFMARMVDKIDNGALITTLKAVRSHDHDALFLMHSRITITLHDPCPARSIRWR